MTNGNGKWPLPEGWVWTTISSIGANEKNAIVDGPFGSNLKLTDYIDDPAGVPVLTTKNLAGSYQKDNLRFISHAKFQELKRSKVEPGDILMAKIGSCGKTGIYPESMPTAIIPANLLKVTVHPSVNRDYVFYYFNSPAFLKDLEGIIKATAQPAFSVSQFRTLSFPLAPRPYQDQIVPFIETHLTRLDAAVAALRRARANLARYKAAVLKAAVEGRLVAQDAADEPASELLARILAECRARWEAAHPGKKYVEPKRPNVDDLPELPEGWVWATVEEMVDVATGATPKRDRSHYWINGSIPWLTSAVVNSDYVDEANEYITDEALRETNAKVFPSGTLLVAMYGEGKTRGKVTEMRLTASTNQALAALIFQGISNQIRRYLKLFLMSNYEDMRRLSSGGVQPNLNLSHIKQTTFPLPPIEEQQQIVTELDRRLSIIQSTEQTLDANLARAERLRQAVLGKAFRGEL